MLEAIQSSIDDEVFSLDLLAVRPSVWLNCARRDFWSYVGPLIKVRDLTTGVETDIYPGADGWLNQGAVIAACPSGHLGGISTFYDQTGNGRHFTTTARPIIYNGSAVVLLGTKPAMDFDGATTFLSRADACGLVGTPAVTMVSVFDADSVGAAEAVASVGRNDRTAANGCIFATVASGSAAIQLITRNASTTFGAGISAGAIQLPNYTIAQLAAGAGFGGATCRVNGAAATETAEVSPSQVLSLLNEITLISALQGAGTPTPDPSLGLDGRLSAFGLWSSVVAGADLAIVEAACAGLIV